MKLVKLYEKFLGQFANLNITVTKSMKKYLVKEFGFQKSKLLHCDRPGVQFQPLSNKREFMSNTSCLKTLTLKI